MKPGYSHFGLEGNGIIFWAYQTHSFIDGDGKKVYHVENIDSFESLEEANGQLQEWRNQFWD